ncbi:MAG: response regulator [Oscillospiraceae bacterium]|jgi:putative two-component system response regulator|nr:response regulator [Oscillospiraceae bacterium]
MTKQVIMIVDDNLTNLKIAKNALSNTYKVFTAVSAAVMFELLAGNRPALILLDIDMPGMSGYEAIKLLKASPETKDIPVVFLTAKSDSDSEIEGLDSGAVDYIAKPFIPSLLRRRVELHLTIESQKDMLAAQVIALQSAILKTVVDLVESRDDITGGHVERAEQGVRILIAGLLRSGLYSEELGSWDIDLLLYSTHLHDVGKITISDSVLLKPGKLTEQEFDYVKKHTIYGEQLMDKIMAETAESSFLKYAKTVAAAHQEKWDGSGYPNGLRGTDIPLPGRLMAIADVYDTLTSERPYKSAFTHEEAVEIIKKDSGTHFEPALVEIFEEYSEYFRKIREEPDYDFAALLTEAQNDE